MKFSVLKSTFIKLAAFLCLLEMGFSQAVFPTERGDDNPHKTCIIGKDGHDGWNLRVGYVGELGRGEDEKACQTRFEINGDRTIIYRSGKAASACLNEAKDNPTRCYSDEAFKKGVRVCIFCCFTTECNDLGPLPPM